jgi:hypothetical protein
MSTPDKARETGQFFLALCACSSKAAAATPGTDASVSRSILEMGCGTSRPPLVSKLRAQGLGSTTLGNYGYRERAGGEGAPESSGRRRRLPQSSAAFLDIEVEARTLLGSKRQSRGAVHTAGPRDEGIGIVMPRCLCGTGRHLPYGEPAIVRWISSESVRAPIFFIAAARWGSTVLWLMPKT